MTVHDEPIYTRDEGYLASTHNIEFVLGGKHGRNEMVMPYLVIDRSGNAVDINQPTCHDHYRTCHGCPDRVAEPRCHTTCEGYKARETAISTRPEQK